MKKVKISVMICFATMMAVLAGMVINTIQKGSLDTQGTTVLAICTVMYCSAKTKYDRMKVEQMF